MSRLRLFVLWFAMFAIPFQGYAAASMGLCEAVNAGADLAVPGELIPPHDHLQHTDAADSTSEHGDVKHQCGTCNTCGTCHTTALPVALHTVVLHDLPPVVLADPAFTLASLAPRVLDKPPRC